MTDGAPTFALEDLVPREILDSMLCDDDERVIYPRELAGMKPWEIAQRPRLVAILIDSAESLG